MCLAVQRSAYRWLPLLVIMVSGLRAEPPQADRGRTTAVTFYDHVLPVLQKRCLSCHLPGRVGPMALGTYSQARPWSAAIWEAVKLRHMPPWFADPNYGEFANDPRLTDEEIRLIDTWVSSGAIAGKQPKQQALCAITEPAEVSADVVITAPNPIPIPANKTIDYQYLVFALPFTRDRWVRAAEIRPSDRSVVHHAVLYVREQKSTWLKNAVPGVPYVPSDADALREARGTTADILAIYTPGTPAMICPEGMGKKLPAGADLVLEVHYTSSKTPTSDQPQIGLAMLAETPKKRILTLQMGRDDLRIPPGEPNYKASITRTFPADVLLISLFPHMHLRGIGFTSDIVAPDGHVETLLKVQPNKYDWQLNYVLKTPRLLRKGTVLKWTETFDNPVTPEARPGEQSWDEMMIGFFDVAVDTAVDKQTFFVR